MTDLPVIDREALYEATGGETVLDIDWRVDVAADISITRTRDGGDTTLTLATDYTIEGLGDPRGARAVLTAPALKGDLFLVDGGDPVDAGDASAGVTFVLARHVGNWALTTSYARGDAVTRNGSSYIALNPHTSTADTEPGVGSNWQIYWRLVAAKGDTGAQGPQGPAATFDDDSVDGAKLNSSIVNILADAAPPAAVFPRAWTGWIAGATITGTLDAGLAVGPVGRRDTANTLTVTLASGSLASISEDALLDGGNVAAVQNAGGDWEVLQFQTATLVSGTTYALTNLLRGQGGTAGEMGALTGAAVRIKG